MNTSSLIKLTAFLLCFTSITAFGQSSNKAEFTVDVRPRGNGWEIPGQKFEVIVIPSYGRDAGNPTPQGSTVHINPVSENKRNLVKQIRYMGQTITVPPGFENHRNASATFFSGGIRSMTISVSIDGQSFTEELEIYGNRKFHIPIDFPEGQQPSYSIGSFTVHDVKFDDAGVKQFVDEINGFNSEKEKKSTSGSTASSTDKDKKDSEKEDEDSDTKSDHTVYRPKSNRQLYDELKAMTDAHPEMLNDPKIRTQLRGYKALADRDDRNHRDYNNFKMITGGGYHPQNTAALNSIYQTNANIANVEMAVDAGVDAATNVVNSFIEASNRKTEEGWAAEDNKKDAAMAKKKAIGVWQNQLRENRFAYERDTKKKIEENFKLITTINDLPITYETEEYKEGKPYWKGRVEITPREFVKTTKTMDRTYNLYIAELNGLYGIFGDDGEALYPPQFEGIYAFREIDKRPRFLINIKDKWGEILADGSITEEIKYDGIWYTADKKNKVLKYGDNWQIKSLDGGRLLKQFNTAQISNLYTGGLIPVSNSNTKGFNENSGSYSLSGDGKLYVWEKSTEKGVASIMYESAKKGEVTERIFKMNGKWFITSNFGTKDMKIEPMPSVFVVPVLREVNGSKKWGAIDQTGKTVVPFENSYVKIQDNEFKTDKGTYKIDGTLASKTGAVVEIENAEKEYYDNGNLKAIGAYDANEMASGTWKYYHENGELESVGNYQNGNRNGIWKIYNENGNLKSTGNYKNGDKDGIWAFYFEDGKNINIKKLFPEGSVTIYYKNGRTQGKGKANKEGFFGKWTFYYDNENNSISEEGEYLNNKRVGHRKFYYESGTIQSEGLFENDKETGEWKYYYENGQLKELGKYKFGEKIGKWHQYDENGYEI